MEAGSKVSNIMWEKAKLLAMFRQIWIYEVTGNKERSHPLKSKCRNQHLGQLQCSFCPILDVGYYGYLI